MGGSLPEPPPPESSDRSVRGVGMLQQDWEWVAERVGALGWTLVSDSVCDASAVWCALGSP